MRALAALALALLAACSSVSGHSESPACAGPIRPFHPELWGDTGNALPPADAYTARARQ